MYLSEHGSHLYYYYDISAFKSLKHVGVEVWY